MKHEKLQEEEDDDGTEEILVKFGNDKCKSSFRCWMWGFGFLLISWFLYSSLPPSITSHRIGKSLIFDPKTSKSSYDLIVISEGKPALFGTLGQNLPEILGTPTATCNPGESDECYEYGDYARLYLTGAKAENDYCARVEWYSPFARRIEDCYDIQSGVHWYGGGSSYYDAWPIEKVSRRDAAMIAGDSLGGMEYNGVIENYWLVSSGVAIRADNDVPLFISINSTHPNKICFAAEDKEPFYRREEGIRLKYDLCSTKNATETMKDVYIRSKNKYYAKPSGVPDEGMLIKPFFSTWAEYKMDIDQEKVLALANNMLSKGFSSSSHIEIDDDWETCYGSAEFNSKFPDPKAMVTALKRMGFRTTLWVHPFINYNCREIFDYALEHDYFVRDESMKFAFVSWWQGSRSGIIDFTNPEAVAWWSARLQKLQDDYGIDAFKFDAGESNWLPRSHHLTGDKNLSPNIQTSAYVEAVSKFGPLCEVRVGHMTQKENVFVRMLDKDSKWGYDNGLQSMIPTLLDYGLKGYPYVLPDMIGGNAYGDRPSKELFIRWMQANSFMPSVQFSLLPWNYDQATVDIVLRVLKYREEYSDLIKKAAQESVDYGYPINRPLWWLDPTDPKTFTVDDQYTVGDDLIVAPVVAEDKYSRDIYLPTGNWTIEVPGQEGESVTYEGPILLEAFRNPLSELAFFVRESVFNERHRK